MKKSEALSLYADKQELLDFRRWLELELSSIDKKLHLDEISWIDHYDGTNMEEWECNRCYGRYIGSVKGICPVCHPFEEG